MKTLTEFKKEFNNIDLLKLFEVEVINNNGERDYIIFDVEIRGKKLIASHEPLTKKEEESKYIAFESIDIDIEFSNYDNLQNLHEQCINAVLNSDFYKLA